MGTERTNYWNSVVASEFPSAIFIKTPKCASQAVSSLLDAFCHANRKTTLTLANDSIFRAREKIYDMSIGHVPFEKPYMAHLRSILRGDDVLFLSCVRDPMKRSISHYYYSNQLRYEIDYNAWYRDNHCKDAVSAGWFLPLKETVNNQMACYMGFHSEAELSLKSLRSRYRFVFIAERLQESLALFEDVFPVFRSYGLERANTGGYAFREADVDDDTRELFMENNALDYRLYRLSNEMLDALIEDRCLICPTD